MDGGDSNVSSTDDRQMSPSEDDIKTAPTTTTTKTTTRTLLDSDNNVISEDCDNEKDGEEHDDDDDDYETVTTITRTVRKTTYMPPKDDQDQPLSNKEMNANKKPLGRDMRQYENMDMEDMLDQLTAEEIDILTREVDPDDSLMPPNQRTAYHCDKKATGPLNREQLIDFIHQQALNDPDRPEMVPFQPGVIRGKKWVAPQSETVKQAADEQIALDLDDEYETALTDATENELVDLAAVLGFHSMMNQDQYHASLLGKKMEGEVGWGGITRASQPKPMAPEPPNTTDPEQSIARLTRNDPDLTQLNLNNIKNISDEQLSRLFEAAGDNNKLESLLMSNTALSDRHADQITAMLERNKKITEISLESNFINPPAMARLVKALLKNSSVETFRAANQRSQVLGNKIEMEITKYVEQNQNLLQLGLHFDFNDARARVSSQLQKNRDRLRLARRANVSA